MSELEWCRRPHLLQFQSDGPPIGIPILEWERGDYGHYFGGEPHHVGMLYKDCPKPPHLIYTFDLSDPRFPIQIPGVRWLPLYYPIQYNDSPIDYYVRSDSEIEIVWHDTEWLWDFPYENYPAWFPRTSIILSRPQPLVLDGDDADWFREKYERSPEPVDDLSLVEHACGLYQGAPRSTCSTPSCGGEPMTLFAIIHTNKIEAVEMFWPDSDGKFTYEICPRCNLITASDQA